MLYRFGFVKGQAVASSIKPFLSWRAPELEALVTGSVLIFQQRAAPWTLKVSIETYLTTKYREQRYESQCIKPSISACLGG